jgi:hypothetical protein
LDESQDFTSQSKEIKTSNPISTTNHEMDLLLESFENIKISKEVNQNAKIKKKSTKQSSKAAEAKNSAKESTDSSKTSTRKSKDESNNDEPNKAYVPFSMRMKQIYKNASIFDG